MSASETHSRAGHALGIAVWIVLALAAPLAAEKTDVVVLGNGDRLTGEVKKLQRGKLSFKTDATGTIQIEWDDVASVESRQHFDVEVETGEKLFGALAAAAEEGELTVAGEDESWTLELASVVGLTPIEESFWKRLDGYLDFGFSFTEADDRTQVSFGSEARYQTQKYLRKLSFSAITASQSDVDETNRYDLNLNVLRTLRPKRAVVILASLQHNEELGIDLRTLVGAGVAWRLKQTNSTNFTLVGGASVNRENIGGAVTSQESVEAILGLQFESFKFDHPERDIEVLFTVYPSLSDFERVRAELNVKIRWEIVNDLFLGLSLLESYDSEPLFAGAEKSDLSLITSFGWSF